MLKPSSLRSGFILSASGSLVGKAVAFLVNPLFAFYFGAGHATDVYFFCVSICAFGSAFITSLNAAVIIPEAMHLQASSGRVAAWKFLNGFLYFYVLVATAVALVVTVAPIGSCAILSKFRPDDLRHLASLIRPFSVVFLFSTISTVLSDYLFAQRYFAVPSFLALIPSCATVLSLFLFHRTLGVSCVPIALGVAYAAQCVFLLALLRGGCEWSFTAPHVTMSPRLFKNVALGYLGNATSTINSYVPYFLLSGFNPGTITAFNFAQSVASVPTTVLTSQVSGVLGVRFNELAAEKNVSAMGGLFRQASRNLHYVLVPIACVLLLFGQQTMHILYGRPTVPGDTLKLAAQFLKLLACMIPLSVVNTLSARVLMAERKVSLSIGYQVAFSAVLFAVLIIAVRLFGPVGYPAALVLSYSVNLLVLRPILRRTCEYVQYDVVLKDLAIILSCNLAITALLGYGLSYFRVGSSLLTSMLGCVAYGCLLASVTYIWSLKRTTDTRQTTQPQITETALL